MRVLSDVAREIELYGEPANPGLGRAVIEACRTLSVDGAIVGFRGMGKTLLANLSALAMGKPAVIVNVAKLLAAEGEVELGEISSCHEVDKPLAKWLEGLVGRAAQRVDCNIVVKVEERGLRRLKALVKRLKEFHIMPIFDGFEDAVLRPEKYGYTAPRLLEDFFDLIDIPPTQFGLALPAELWLKLDLQTKSRIAPTHVIRWKVEHMRQFLHRLCQCNPGPIGQLELKNPTAVVNFAEELKQHTPEKVVEKRLEELRHIAQEVAPRGADALFEILKELWWQQNIYADLPRRPGKRVSFLVRGMGGYGLSSDMIERIRAYVYGREELRHLIYELLL